MGARRVGFNLYNLDFSKVRWGTGEHLVVISAVTLVIRYALSISLLSAMAMTAALIFLVLRYVTPDSDDAIKMVACGVGLMLYCMTDRPKKVDNPKPTLPAAASSSSWLPVVFACFLVAVIAACLFEWLKTLSAKEEYWRVAGQLQDELLAFKDCTDEPKLRSKIAVARVNVGSHIETVLAGGDPSGIIRVETATGSSWFSLKMLCAAGDELLRARQHCPRLTKVLD